MLPLDHYGLISFPAPFTNKLIGYEEIIRAYVDSKNQAYKENFEARAMQITPRSGARSMVVV